MKPDPAKRPADAAPSAAGEPPLGEAPLAGPTPTDPPPGEPAPKPSVFRRPWVVVLGALILIAGVTLGTSYLLRSLDEESTDDAFVDASVAQVSAKVAGRVAAVHVEDNQHVEPGAPLVDLDPRDYQALVQQRQAAVQSAIARRAATQTALAQTETRLQTLEAEIAAARAQVTSASAEATRNESELRRSRQLVGSGAISRQEFERATTAAQGQNALLEAARKRVAAAEAQFAEGQAAVRSAEAQIQSAAAEIDQARAALAAAELDLASTHVVAPQAGRVTNRSVVAGNYVQVGQALLAIVPRQQWVTANFKETQLREMHPGQPVIIRIDAYPGRTFRGHVESIQRGSGAQFSLLPPENATGNYVKVVQRVPVKILFDEQRPSPLGPGMSVSPTVIVRGDRPRGWILTGVAVLTAGICVLLARRLLRRPDPVAS